ncbi:Transmembrane protein [Gracilaria domingensis]|nr:Transmembrane protein [Gracilaria domingensis]
MDATLPRPLHRPLNFFGDAEDASAQLDRMLDSSDEETDVLVYGHYPSSTMKRGERVHVAALSDHSGKWRKPRFSAYLSGHLHTLFGLTKNGLQAVSLSGSLELQLPDMVLSRAYRVLLFDSGYMSFKDLRVGKDDGLEQVVVMNPPRAGLCSAGAGYAALHSTHVRLFSVDLNLIEVGAHVWINGEDMGPVSWLPCSDEKNEEPATSTCNHIYGVEWDASQYANGTHELFIHLPEENKSAAFVFSLDGSPEKRWAPRMERIVSAVLALSDFPATAKVLIGVALLFCLLVSFEGILRRSKISTALALLSFNLFLGPMLIVRDIIDGEPGWSFIGLHYMHMPTGVYPAGVDASYLLSTAVVWRSLFPFCFLDALAGRVLAGALIFGALTASLSVS